jgi:tetratricopeptide (TPR) repeat protein
VAIHPTMALRLSGPAPAPRSPSPAAALAAEADALLLARDLDGQRELWRRAAAFDDVHHRYQARRALADHALAATAQVAPAQAAWLFAVLADELLGALEEEPREPVLLNQAAIALYELWSLDAAGALFRAAQRLDPELAHVGANLAQLACRRAQPAAPPVLPASARAMLPALAERAARVAHAARPAEGLTLTLAMIVRDEEEMLPRCLTAVAPAVDEIVIVDTGSTDRTVQIAEAFGAKVLHHEWTGSFADARNVSFAAATGDWVLYLDADEVLVAEDRAALRALTGRTWREAFYLVETNHTGELDDGTAVVHNALRMFRNRAQYRFTGALHEQVADKLPAGLPERLEASRVRIEHYGYLASVRDAKGKSRRNVEILRRQLEEAPERTPFMHFNLGAEHLAAGDVDAAVSEFETAWAMIRDGEGAQALGYASSLAARLVKGLRAQGRLAEAGARCEEALALFPGFTDLVLEQGFVAQQDGDEDRAAALFERCLQMGEAPSRFTSVAGSGTFLAARALAEIHRRRGDLERACELLERTLREHPRYLGIVDPLAGALLAAGVAPPEVVARVTAGVAQVTPSVRFLLGTALYEAGAAEEAREQFAAVVRRQPTSGAARAALGEALLSLGRLAEAAEVADGVATGDPAAPAAARTAIFACLAQGDAEAGAPALARAVRAGMAPAEHGVYAAWLRAIGGEAGPAPALSPAGLEPLAVALEALLRLGAYDAFETLLGVLPRTGVPEREARELLAGIYLRRGFVESAAEEWLAVCREHGPDAAALVGLAQVAAAQGLSDDALVFAREAQDLRPDDPRAGRLVEALSAS